MSFLGDLVTAEQAAAHCGVARTTVYYWHRTKKLRPADHDGRQWLYLMYDVVKTHGDVGKDTQHSHRKPRAVPGWEAA